jgi:predicted RNase H-like nuclease (RuvC/YqgF family)
MEWYNIVLLLLGGVGGTAGLISIYKAKAEKTGIDIGNMKEMLNEAHRMFDTACEERDSLQTEFKEYKDDTMQYISEFKERFVKVEKRLDKAEETVLKLKGAINRGYRCRYPESIEECPVIKEYEKIHCTDCPNIQEETLLKNK